MRYLLSVINSGAPQASPSEEAQIDAFNEKMQAAGQRVVAHGLYEPELAKSVDARGEVPRVIDGLVNSTAEFMIGFWIVDVDSDEMAMQLAIEGSRACQRKIELRQIHG